VRNNELQEGKHHQAAYFAQTDKGYPSPAKQKAESCRTDFLRVCTDELKGLNRRFSTVEFCEREAIELLVEGRSLVSKQADGYGLTK